MKILEQIQAKETRMNEIVSEIESAEDVTKVTELSAEHSRLAEERSALQTALNVQPVQITQPSITQRNVSGLADGEEDLDPRNTREYRKAFMNYVKSGKMIPELRADATTVTTDVSALIPTSIMNRVVEELESYGNIYQRITKSNIAGGVEIPISSVKPTASWVSEGSVADKKKLTASSKISFGYYKLQIRIATSLEASVATLDLFEKLIAKAMTRAIVKAIEASVFNGTGTGQPTGLLVDTRIAAGQKYNFKATDATFDGWMKNFISKIKNAYATLSGNVICVNKATWDTYMAGMVDTNKQPVGRVNMGIGGRQERSFLGYPVEIVDYLPSFDTASVADVFLTFGDLSEFVLNSNLQLTYRKYYDENTDEWIEKSTLVADGKVADPAGFIMLKKATA